MAPAREWEIGIVAGPPAVLRCYVTLRRERMVGLRAGLWNSSEKTTGDFCEFRASCIMIFRDAP